MSKIWLVLKNEWKMTVQRRSFVLTLILVPLVPFVVMLVVSLIRQNNPQANPIGDLFAPPTEPEVTGYVDLSGMVRAVPPDLQGLLVAYENEAQADAGLQRGDVDAYIVIAADYLQSGQVVYVRPDFSPLGGLMQSDVVRDLLNYNLLDGDAVRFENWRQPVVFEYEYLSPEEQRDPGNALTFFLPYITAFVFYMVILGSASLMLNSISKEKENRVMEVLMTSITPTQMMAGKMIGLGLAGLLQTVVWSIGGLLTLRFSGTVFELPDAFQLSPVLVVWGVLYFVLGYAVYAALMGGIGALAPNLRETGQTVTLVIMPLVVPLMFINLLIDKPNHPLSILFSLFPLTAPVGMMARLAGTNVPLWQNLMSLLLLALSAWLAVRAAAGIFRAQNLLSGQPLKLKLFLKALIKP
jgi:ABC-2 type transport system permease protein